ncbi:MAG: hypothetical protein ACLFUP_08380 [Desulfobacteraceae bacterium]
MDRVVKGATRPRHAVLLAATSACVLAHQILLMRILSYSLWHHLASMVISMALLGFGSAGSFLFLLRGPLSRAQDGALTVLAALAALSFPVSLLAFESAGLDPLRLAWDAGEWLDMGAAYLSLSLPFLLSGSVVAIILSRAGERTPGMYAFDLMGAGCGALGVVPVLFLGFPWELVVPLAGVLLLAAVPCALASRRSLGALACIALSAGLTVFIFQTGGLEPKIHESKGLPVALNYPDARVEAVRTGPTGVVHAVGSDFIHHAPGLSLAYESGRGGLPEQKGLFVDGDGPLSVTRWRGKLDSLEFLDYTPQALPYHVRRPLRAAVIGAGGGSEVLLSVFHRTPEIVAVESSLEVAELMTGPLDDFSGRVFTRAGVALIKDDPRRFFSAFHGKFDLVQLTLSQAFGAASGGAGAAREEYLYTTEAFCSYLERLTERGLLSVTCWLKAPPRDSLRVTATALEALAGLGYSAPERHVVFIRSWQTATVLVSRRPFTRAEITKVKEFCRERSFDTAYYQGMPEEEANRYDIQPSPWYYQGARSLTEGGGEAFLEGYVFDVSPTYDDRPYFSHFFRWDRAAELLRHFEWEWLPRMESGYLFVLATLVQASIAGLVLVFLPVFFLRRSGRREAQASQGIGPCLLYFACPGLGFMMFEMALLPEQALVLADPVYAASAVIGGILVFAGLGSASIRALGAEGRGFVWLAAAGLLAWVLLREAAAGNVAGEVLRWGAPGRIVFTMITLAPCAFILGWPFPLGLRALGRVRPSLVPWAWAVNGCASVAGAVLGKCLAMSLGFRAVLLVGCCLYVLAAVLFRWIEKVRPD